MSSSSSHVQDDHTTTGDVFDVGRYVTYHDPSGADVGPVRIVENFEEKVQKLDMSDYEDIYPPVIAVYPWAIRACNTVEIAEAGLHSRGEQAYAADQVRSHGRGEGDKSDVEMDEASEAGIDSISDRAAVVQPEDENHGDDDMLQQRLDGNTQIENGSIDSHVTPRARQDRTSILTRTPHRTPAGHRHLRTFTSPSSPGPTHTHKNPANHVPWTIISSSMDRRMKDPYTQQQGLTKYKVRKPNAKVDERVKYTQIPDEHRPEVVAWHKANPDVKMPEEWEVLYGGTEEEADEGDDDEMVGVVEEGLPDKVSN